MNCAQVGVNAGTKDVGLVEIDASGLNTKELNDILRDKMILGADKFVLRNVCGQRYIGTRLYLKGSSRRVKIEIFGTPGNDIGAFLFGHSILVHGNVQDGVGNTMDDGEIVVEGRGGDVLGLSMRGGKIFIKNSVGYRTALHMKEYLDKKPVVVIGGTTQDFLGEYMAGGSVILLGIGIEKHNANFIGTGMHGGAIFLRGKVDKSQLGAGVDMMQLSKEDREFVAKYIKEFFEKFPDLGVDPETVSVDEFVKLAPVSKRPYGNMYAY